MGMDYRYLLFFERAARLGVLERLAEMAEDDLERRTLLVLPDRIVALPFEGWLETGARLSWDDPSPSWDFMTVLCFEPDEAITDYLERMHRRAGLDHHDDLDELGRAGIGIVYLSVRNDLRSWGGGTARDLVLFDFSTPGSSMSVLFSESESIRTSFARLLEAGGGVYGVLDREDSAELFWWRGRDVSVWLPQADLPVPQIERLLDEES